MEILKTNLDDIQLRAASQLQKNCLLLAGPGSGKTHMLAERASFLIRATPTESFHVLCLAFTVEAAKEMRRRLTQQLPQGARGRVTVMNFHQFALDLLRAYGHLIGLDREFTILGEVDRAELVEDTVASLPYGRVNTTSVVDLISNRKGRREYRGDLLQRLERESLRRIFIE